jgi:hypothetical protein
MSNIAIVTYPRSGANYLSNLLVNACGQEIRYSHTAENPDRFIITIARNPYDSIHSHVTMRKHYNPDEGYNESYNREYKNMYNFLYKNADIVIDYKELIEFPDKILSQIFNEIEIEKRPTDIPYPMPLDNKENTYLRSSKTSHEYNSEHFKKEQILDCYEPYNKLLSKAISVSEIKI